MDGGEERELLHDRFDVEQRQIVSREAEGTKLSESFRVFPSFFPSLTRSLGKVVVGPPRSFVLEEREREEKEGETKPRSKLWMAEPTKKQQKSHLITCSENAGLQFPN